MSKRDYYEVLGVSRSATEQELKSAYRRLAVRYHPDKNPGDTEAEERFKEAAEAYSVLSNPEQRQRYDRLGHAGVSGAAGGANWGEAGFGGLEDLLSEIFGFGDVFGAGGRGGRTANRGADLRYDLEITLEQAAEGMTAKLKIPRLETCATCTGQGTADGSPPDTCPTCRGTGQVRFQQGFFSVARTCSHCRGTGKVVASPCADCRGAGRVEQHKEVEARIPAGVETGSRLRLQGEGEAGPNGGPNGDLYVVILVREHPDFERQAANLYTALPITFSQAALGADLPVKTLNGPQELKIPAGTQTGTVFRMRGHGMPVLGGHGKGDLFIAINVVTPQDLTHEQRKLFEELAKIESDEAGFMDKVRDFFSQKPQVGG
jgi:molecular chaperone DnaJ